MIIRKGGLERLVVSGFKNYDKVVIPAGSLLQSVTVKKSGTTAGNIKLGTYVAPKAETQTLTVTAEPTADGTLSIVLNGAAGVNIAILNADTMAGVATKIAAGTYPGWTAVAIGSKVVFTATTVGAKAGAFTFGAAATGVTASFAETVPGVTEAVGEQVVASVALSTSDGNMSSLTLVKNLFNVDTEVAIGVDSAATGDIAFSIQKLF